MKTEDIKVRVVKCETPIIWLDTSIINLMTQWRHKLCKLDGARELQISALFTAIYEATRKGRLICPLAEQEGEVWVERDKWMETINTLSLGIEALDLLAIHDNQFRIFMRAFVENQNSVTLSYREAFDDDPADELTETLRQPFFITDNSPLVFGETYRKKLKNNLHQTADAKRARNVEAKVTFEQQLEKEFLGDIQGLSILVRRFLSGQFKDEEDQFNATCGALNLGNQLTLWKSICGRPEGLEGLMTFYRSSYYRAMPYTDLSCNLFARMMTDKQPIRSGDPMDIKHVSTFMPFSDIFVTDKAMSTFLRKRKLDEQYRTTVCYIGDTNTINQFFSHLR